MSTHSRPAGRHRRILAASIVVALGLGLAACGDGDDSRTSTDGGSINKSGLESADPTSPSDATTTGADGTSATDTDPMVIADRQDPVPGLVEVEGATGSLTTRARSAFSRTNPGTTVTENRSGEGRSFERLCIGDVDIVDSSRPISADEYQQCRRNGLDVVQFQVAADAVILAIRSQTDVGTDCLSTDQVRAAFRAGSTIDNWSQLGPNLDNVELETGGPTVDVNAARFFGRYVLDTEDPLAADFRVDYQASESENRTLRFVTGSDRDRTRVRDLSFITPEWTKQQAQVKKSRSEYVKALDEVRAAVAEQRKGVRDNRTAAARGRDDARVTRAYERRGIELTEYNADRARFAPINRTYRDLLARKAQIADEYGRVGLFSHGFYAAFEDRLRPFEIEVSDGDDQPNCIFPSPQTILNGQYPLSRQLLLTVTTRSLQRPEVRAFLTEYLANSQRYADNAGLVALPDADIARQSAWLDEGATLPRFGVVDGKVTEITEETTTPVTPAPAPAQNPAR